MMTQEELISFVEAQAAGARGKDFRRRMIAWITSAHQLYKEGRRATRVANEAVKLLQVGLDGYNRIIGELGDDDALKALQVATKVRSRFADQLERANVTLNAAHVADDLGWTTDKGN